MPDAAVAVDLQEYVLERARMDVRQLAVHKACVWVPNLFENRAPVNGHVAKRRCV